MRKYGFLRYTVLFLLLTAFLASGCSKKKAPHDEAAHKAEPVQITAYSDKLEAFVEFAEPVAGEQGTFLIYLTRLADWKPVTQGGLKVVLTPSSGAPVEVNVPAPARPGVYEAKMTAATAGEYTLSIIPQTAELGERIVISPLHVLKEGEAHEHAQHAGEAAHRHDEAAAKGARAREDTHEGEHAAHGKGEQAGHGHEEKEAEHHAEVEEKGHGQEKDGHGHEGEAGHADEHEGEQHAVGDHHDEEHPVIVGTGGGTITFLKEQQWATDFMTSKPELKSLASYFSTMGELVPVSNAEATVSAPLGGIISGSRALPFVGKKVSKGEIVAVIEPPVHQEGGMGELAASWAEAKNRVTLAQKEYDRARRLYEAKIAPLKRVEEAELALSSARAALQPLQKAMESVKGDAGSRIAVRAPVSGTVVEVAASNGKGVVAGEPILRIINTGTLWLKANIPAADAGKAALASGATFTVTGLEGEFRPTRLVTVNDMLDPQTRTLSAIFVVPNPGGRLKVGMFANVMIKTGEAKNALAVPEGALVEDEGRWFLFVQTAAQAFERREVKIGARDKGYVQIMDGLEDHERVVTRGVYYVKLAATAGKGIDPHAGHGH